MKAAAIDKFGPPEVLTVHAFPIPKAGPKDVLIALHSAGVGIWDSEIRKGEYSIGRKKFPLVLGADGAGIIAGVGKDVRRFKEGDQVWSYHFSNTKSGFYAEYIAVNAKNVAGIPSGLSLLEAGAAAVTGLTALQGVDDHLKVNATDTVLIFGATGAVGTLAVQFARRTGARVIATASTGRGSKTLRDLGIEDVLDPRATGAANQVVAGGRVFYPGGVEPEPKKRPKIKVSTYDAEVGPEEFERLNRAVAESNLKVVIEQRFKLEDARQAHVRLEQGHVVGRIVLEIR
jgi:NADPH:quinone reductase